MEIQWLIYLAKVNAAVLIFYLTYIVVFRHDTFFRFRRCFLFSSIVFALVYPFFSVDALGGWIPFTQSPLSAEATVIIGEPSAILVGEDTPDFVIPWNTVLVSLLATGTLFLFFRLLWQLISIMKIRCRCQRKVISGYTVCQVPQEITPFSFFRWVFLHIESHSEEELHQILLHERTHVRQWHSVDIMLAELLCLFSWWNPAVWLLRREITINLEYLADKDVLQHGIESKEYQYHLLKLTYHATAVQIGNNFNVSQLKQRIVMMNQTKTPALKSVKYLAVFPLALLLITLNSCLSKEKKSDESTTTETVGSLPETPAASPEAATEEKEEVFVVVEEQPLYPGGNSAMMKFLADNIKYPVEAQEKGIQGRVITNFLVEKDGSLSDVRIVRGIDPLLDNEAIRVIQTMPRWNPGRQKGREVSVRFTLPVVFRLQEDDAKTATAPPPPPPIRRSASDEVYNVVKHQPEFPGGNSALMEWLSKNINYPRTAQENGIQGRVITNFIIEKDGSISDVRITRGVDTSLDEEAIRVVKSMPHWNPGVHNGEMVRVRYTLPIVYRLQQ